MTGDRKELYRLLDKIYRERGFDFREYRETTLTRRLSRRLHARGAHTYADYACMLDQDPTEYDTLFDDLTINVTTFFRDEVAFDALQEVALPRLIHAEVEAHRALRIWSAGCATGEEPYSIAMLVLEHLGGNIGPRRVTIIGTDIDTKALQRAQEGVFAPQEVEGIRPAWLDRYFVHEHGGFRVQSALRKLVTFEVHNMISDPPYRDLDLVVCRNVLIYFTPPLQMRVLKGFRRGLNEGGFLLLGKAEVSVGESRRLFCCVDPSAKLYRACEPENGKEEHDGSIRNP